MYNDDGLGLALPAIGGALSTIGGIFKPKSPRYGGGDGPMYSTINSYVDRIAQGDSTVIPKLNQLRKSDADKVQWQLFWDNDMVTQPMTDAQWQQVLSADPSKAAYGRPPIGPGVGIHVTAVGSSQSGSAYTAPSSPSYVPSSPLGGPVVAGLSAGPLVLAGAAALAIFALTRKR